MFISVVLPAPFSPSSPTTSPRRTSKVMPSLATSGPNRLVMPVSRRTVSLSDAIAGHPHPIPLPLPLRGRRDRMQQDAQSSPLSRLRERARVRVCLRRPRLLVVDLDREAAVLDGLLAL